MVHKPAFIGVQRKAVWRIRHLITVAFEKKLQVLRGHMNFRLRNQSVETLIKRPDNVTIQDFLRRKYPKPFNFGWSKIAGNQHHRRFHSPGPWTGQACSEKRFCLFRAPRCAKCEYTLQRIFGKAKMIGGEWLLRGNLTPSLTIGSPPCTLHR